MISYIRLGYTHCRFTDINHASGYHGLALSDSLIFLPACITAVSWHNPHTLQVSDTFRLFRTP